VPHSHGSGDCVRRDGVRHMWRGYRFGRLFIWRVICVPRTLIYTQPEPCGLSYLRCRLATYAQPDS
jgi:hypothetical protein